MARTNVRAAPRLQKPCKAKGCTNCIVQKKGEGKPVFSRRLFCSTECYHGKATLSKQEADTKKTALPKGWGFA